MLQENERNPKNRTLSRKNRGVIISFELDFELMYTVDDHKCKYFPFKDEEWADYIVCNRIHRESDTPHEYVWTYGALADGKSLGFLCRRYANKEISVNQLINGFTEGHTNIRGIAPHSDNYTQLSFHDDENFVNSVLKFQEFSIIDQYNISQER